MTSEQEQAKIQRDLRISRRKTAKDLQRENLKIWKHIIMDAFRTVRQLMALLVIGIGIIIALFATIAIMSVGLYRLIIG